MADADIVVAGHICLDMTPDFPDTGARRMDQILRPGMLTEVGECIISTGGFVANTGIALHKLGMDVRLMGKIGDDAFGEVLRGILSEHGCGGAVVVPGEQTSYTIVVAPRNIDRMFLHNPGANSTFGEHDVDFDAVAGARLLHLGYPPLMARLYADQGEQLVRIFRRARQAGAATSMDMAFPDPEAASGRVDWRRLFERVLPHVDLFLPSVEEMMFCLERERFDALRQEADAAGASMLDLLVPDDLSRLARALIDMGAAVVSLKCGHRGIYLRTADAERLQNMGRAKPGDVQNWAERELWVPARRVERVVSATGAGDCAVAGFLAAFLRGESLEHALHYAALAGMLNVRAHDAVSGLRPWPETTALMPTAPLAELAIDAEGWSWDEDTRIWSGPAQAEA